MSLATRAAKAISRRRIPTPSSAPRCHPSSLLSIHRRYQHVFHPDRSHFSTHAGIQAPKLSTTSCFVRDENDGLTIPRGDRSWNTADRIQDELEEKGHRVWGLVIYRCTYGDDAAWGKCLERLNASTRKSMRFYNGLDLLGEGCYKPTVIAGARFNGAKTQYVRERFKEWRRQAILEEQGSPEEIEARRKGPEPVFNPYGIDHYSMAVRYRFCVQIDEAAMRNIISSESGIDDACVNVIEADWFPKDAATQFEEAWVEHGPDKDTFDHVVEIFPEIEGCIEENTGWMKVRYNGLVPGFYASMTDPNTLEEFLYWRPPDFLPAALC
jgi:hypothetical protein